MICDQCLNSVTKFTWRNNMKLCNSCTHTSYPYKRKKTQDHKPTIYDLKRKWEKTNW